MRQEIIVDNDQVLVTLSGGVYIEQAGILKETLIRYIDKGHRRFVIDLADVNYIDSSGLGVLVAIQKRALQHHGGVTIQGMRGIVKDLFHLTQLTRVFEIIP